MRRSYKRKGPERFARALAAVLWAQLIITASFAAATLWSGTARAANLTTLVSFCALPDCADGASPSSLIMDAKGNLFGTTLDGGNPACHGGCGAAMHWNLSKPGLPLFRQSSPRDDSPMASMASFLAGSVIFLLRAASRAGFLGKERHGYDIMLQVKTDSENAVKMGPGTLCGSLANDGRPNRISPS
jgi:hypothetical protein